MNKVQTVEMPHTALNHPQKNVCVERAGVPSTSVFRIHAALDKTKALYFIILNDTSNVLRDTRVANRAQCLADFRLMQQETTKLCRGLCVAVNSRLGVFT
ncbi:hypothetical protein ACMFMF_008048 [Clarireedia jacksonii]